MPCNIRWRLFIQIRVITLLLTFLYEINQPTMWFTIAGRVLIGLSTEKWLPTKLFKNNNKGRSPSLVVMGDDSRSKGHGFKSRRHILDWYFSHWFVVKIIFFVWIRPKINEKEAGVKSSKKQEDVLFGARFLLTWIRIMRCSINIGTPCATQCIHVV